MKTRLQVFFYAYVEKFGFREGRRGVHFMGLIFGFSDPMARSHESESLESGLRMRWLFGCLRAFGMGLAVLCRRHRIIMYKWQVSDAVNSAYE